MDQLETVELVFVELEAHGEEQAKRRVEAALGALGLTGFVVTNALPDPDRQDVFGVEVSAPPDTTPPAGWDAAHALAAHLAAHAEAVLRAELEVHEAKTMFGALEGTGGEQEVFVQPPPRWHLGEINAMNVGSISMGAGVLIGHPDTGTTEHRALGKGRVRQDLGLNLLEGGPPVDPLDDEGQPGHGTATSSLMISKGVQVDGRRVYGLARKAEVVPIRVTNTVVVLTWQSRLARAIEHAIEKGCKVISMSLGGLGGSRLRRAIRAARRSGAVVVAAAGNYVQFVVWPAMYPEVIGVAATGPGPGRRPWWGSSKGRAVSITAPGAAVEVAQWDTSSAVRKETVGPSDGTSFAAALVASTAALWLSFHGDEIARRYRPSEVHDAFRALLRKTAKPLAATEPFPPSWFGAGMLDCADLLAAALPDPSEIETTVKDFSPRDELASVLSPLVLASRIPSVDGWSGIDVETSAADRSAGAWTDVESFLARRLEARRGANEATAGMPPAVTAELVQHTVLDKAFRDALVAAITPSAPTEEPLPVPELATKALRAWLGERSPGKDEPRSTSPAPAQGGAPRPEPPKPPDVAVSLQLNVEVEIRVGAIRTEYLPGRPHR